MDGVRDDMGIETNYSNPKIHVPEPERKNRVIKDRFLIAYYLLPYENIPMIMIYHLVMNVTRSLNMFPAKVGVPDHYSPHTILSQMNWDYNKHCWVEFGAYVQESQAHDPNNTNRLRKLDVIYLCLGHKIMDLRPGQFITRPKLLDITITDVVIKAVEKWRRSKDLSH